MPNRHLGLTLIELLVTLVIVAILAGVAAPYAELAVRREKESELKRHLREVRTAIDSFHRDWEKGLIPVIADIASIDGYPRTLEILVEPIRLADGRERKYLRRVPRDPFDQAESVNHWRIVGYRDPPDAATWNGEDVWDIASSSVATAIDGSSYGDW